MFPKTAKVALVVAIAGFPLGLFFGFLLAVGQDAAGAGMVQGFGILLGLAVSVVALVVYAAARVNWRLPQIQPANIKNNAGKIVVTLLLLVGLIAAIAVIPSAQKQVYTLGISNDSGGVISDIVIQVGQTEVALDKIEPNILRKVFGNVERPPGTIVASWTDSAGTRQTASATLFGGLPEYYNNGLLLLTVGSGEKMVAIFVDP